MCSCLDWMMVRIVVDCSALHSCSMVHPLMFHVWRLRVVYGISDGHFGLDHALVVLNSRKAPLGGDLCTYIYIYIYI